MSSPSLSADGEVDMTKGSSATRRLWLSSIQSSFDVNGRIAAVTAEDRSRKEGAGFVARPSRGWFFDYRERQGGPEIE